MNVAKFEMFFWLLAAAAAAVARPLCPSTSQYTASAIGMSTIQTCIGAPSETWQRVVVKGGAAEWLYCYRNRSYIAVTEMTNYATIQAAKTSFCAIAVDPTTLRVDVGVLTFSETVVTGPLWGAYAFAPYAFAGDCQQMWSSSSVDLVYTPFALHNATETFVADGYMPVASIMSSRNDLVFMSIQGFCAWITVAPAMAGRGTRDWSAAGHDNANSACENFGFELPLVRKAGGDGGPSPTCARTGLASSCTAATRFVPGCEPAAPPTTAGSLRPTPRPTLRPTPRPMPSPSAASSTTSTASLSSPPPSPSAEETETDDTEIVFFDEEGPSPDLVTEWWFLLAVVLGGALFCVAVIVVIAVIVRNKRQQSAAPAAPAAAVPAAAVPAAPNASTGVYGAAPVAPDPIPKRHDYSAFSTTGETVFYTAPPAAASTTQYGAPPATVDVPFTSMRSERAEQHYASTDSPLVF